MVNEKRVLHLTHTDINSDSRIIKEMLSAKKNGFQVSGVGIKLSEGAKNSELDGFDIKTLDIRSRSLKFLPDFLRHLLTFLEFFIKAFVYSLSRKPDIIHCNDTLVLPIGVFVKVFTRAKLVYDAHELESDRNALSKGLGKLTLFIEKIMWPFVDGLIVVSPSIEQWYYSNVGEKRSAVVLNSPVYKEDDKVKSCYLRDKYEISSESHVFIYVGILAAGRGIESVLEAFINKPNAHLVFLGYGPYYEMLKEAEGKYKNVHVHDAVEHNRVVEIASSADVGLCLIENVSLSDYYSLPNKLFEYAFSGLSVLASNFPDISKVVDDFNLGTCVNLTVEDIKKGIDLIESRVNEGNKVARSLDELSWHTQEQKLIALYRNVV